MSKIMECPICRKRIVINITINTGKDRADWFQCQCGCWIKGVNGCDKTAFNEKYKVDYAKGRGVRECLAYQRRIYTPLIGELTVGREILDVGFTLDENIKAWRKDGWVAEGIDLMKDDNPNTFVGDFETYEFKKQYDVLWMADVIQNFDNAIAGIVKAFNLLKPDGVLFISTPAPGLIHELGWQYWGCWNNKTDNIYFAQDNLVKILEYLGMEVIMKRENIQPRFNIFNNTHILCQKHYPLNGDGGENKKQTSMPIL